jgi:glycosyltransferase involved in cell wall biosynthesis
MIKMNSNITFVIFTYNEERRIERMLQNFQQFGKILIADNKSTDKTLEIASAYGCDILLREKNYVWLENQDLAELVVSKITTDWLFWLYADEMIGKETLEKIALITTQQSSDYDIINIFRKNYFYGEFCYDFYQSSTNRIFKKGAIDFTDNVIHGFGKETVAPERIYKLSDKYFIHQFIDYTASIYLKKTDTYTEIERQFSYSAKKSIWFFLFRVCKNILKNYYWDKGYKMGFPGLAITELSIVYELVKNIKLYEVANNINRESIEQKNDAHRDNILIEFGVKK